MSDFKKYACELNELANELFDNYNKAKAEYDRAEELHRKHPERGGMVEATKAAEIAEAKAKYLSAQSELKEAETRLIHGNDSIISIRAALEKSIKSAYSANPEDVDNNVITLINSGILSDDEYIDLFNKAVNNGNTTTARLIAAKADENKNNRPLLGLIAEKGRSLNGSRELSKFDDLSEIYYRCSHNTAMIPYWEELTANMIDAF